MLCGACSAGKSSGSAEVAAAEEPALERPAFDVDSAYSYVERQVAFGPRVPGTAAHAACGDWLAGKLRALGWEVIEQRADLTAFDGTVLPARNIFARLNPEAKDRLLLLAHWDSRPWADQDPDPAKRKEPVTGANDGASGAGVLLEVARQLAATGATQGVDILLVDAEDWGETNDEESWALGTRYFAEHLPVEGYRPSGAILLDMVGSPSARFGLEYFSQEAAPALQQQVWNTALRLGHGKYFHTGFGGAVTDDHVQLIEHGIPTIDIIDYRQEGGGGFDPVWHTASDNMANISRQTLGAVGETVIATVKNR